MVIPFVLLLVAMALGPVLCSQWWGRHYAKVALGLAAVTVTYYLAGLHAASSIVHTAREYVGFIGFIGSLFVVAGGIHITIKGEATPVINVLFLAIGAVIANVLGTTGASMLLIRPWLRMNKYRVTGHHVVFFIFIVSNVGGCLTPIGDPPLFLGYLRGIPFWWVAQHCWVMWLVGVGALLAIFLIIDWRNYVRAPAQVRAELAGPPDRWRLEGLHNLAFLAIILGAIFIDEPPLLREALMLSAAALSYYTTPRSVHEANGFTFHPIQEVAVLFIGIFATMLPALDWLEMNAGRFGQPSVSLVYWASGLLSSTLDNAPTYLSFLQATSSAFVDPATVGKVQQLISSGQLDVSTQAEPLKSTIAGLVQYFGPQLKAGSVAPEQIEVAFLLGAPALNQYLVALSIAAVFFGAATYIGNGPNFIVKSIAAHQKVHTLTFLAYVFKYSVPFLLPVLILVWWLFFRETASQPGAVWP